MSDLCSLIRARLADRVYRRKLSHTVCIFYCYVAVGMVLSQTGPALLDLQLITNTNTEQGSLFITVANIGSIVGSLAMGYLFGRWNKVLMMSTVSLAIAVTDVALPWCSAYGLMVAMHGLVAMFRSAFSTAVTVDIIRIWAPNSRVYMQILNTCFSVGGAIAPLIVQPFLAPRKSENITSVSDNSSYQHSLIAVRKENTMSDVDGSIYDKVTTNEESLTTHIQFVYLIPGVWFLIGSSFFLSEYFQSDTEDKSLLSSQSYESLEKPLPLSLVIGTLTFLFWMFFFLICLQTSLSSFLLTFAATYLNWTKTDGANLTTDYWLCHALGRFISIFFTRYVSPFKCLLLSSCVTLVATVGNVFSALTQFDTGVWLSTGTIGLFISTQVPSLMLWTEESLMHVTPRVVSVFNFSISFPAIVVPQILGYLMQEVSPMWMFYLNVIHIVAFLILLLFIYMWGKLVVQPRHRHLNRLDTLKEAPTKTDENQT